MKVTRKTYTQNWNAYNAAQTHEKSELQALLYELCKNLPEPEQRRGKGRPPLSLADIIFSSAYKIYSTRSQVAAFRPICGKRNSAAIYRRLAALQFSVSITLNQKR